ncbi:Sua5/YciO/YrdC/YwlC family protein [Candidatus Saccharibacteria bacterium]|nr:Sua5/YciO/YrdC/YwlC family protein [Candidatus Saccharibacteria bacterium]
MKKQIVDPWRDYGVLVEDTEIASTLLAGGVAEIPTETVNGWAALLNSEKAIRKLMKMKEREVGSGKVFTLVPESVEAISKYAVVSELANALISRYMPGEITLILPKNPDFRHFYYDNFETIGIRIPNIEPFPVLLEGLGAMVLTSANPRGGTPHSITGHKPSTIVDLTGEKPRILRQGDLVVEV